MSKEYIYYVNEYDEPSGEIAEKFSAHTDKTRLHGAFSCYVFNDAGELLVTKRAATKKVWPNVWTNSCCGHPAPGEKREDAISRRLKFELGMTVKDIRVIVPDYIYKTPPYNGIVEHEYCPVYSAVAVDEPLPNPDEVEDYKWVSWQWFLDQTHADHNDYSDPQAEDAPVWSWWCKDQIPYILKHAAKLPIVK